MPVIVPAGERSRARLVEAKTSKREEFINSEEWPDKGPGINLPVGTRCLLLVTLVPRQRAVFPVVNNGTELGTGGRIPQEELFLGRCLLQSLSGVLRMQKLRSPLSRTQN